MLNIRKVYKHRMGEAGVMNVLPKLIFFLLETGKLIGSYLKRLKG